MVNAALVYKIELTLGKIVFYDWARILTISHA